jgi:hypothetical protein
MSGRGIIAFHIFKGQCPLLEYFLVGPHDWTRNLRLLKSAVFFSTGKKSWKTNLRGAHVMP